MRDAMDFRTSLVPQSSFLKTVTNSSTSNIASVEQANIAALDRWISIFEDLPVSRGAGAGTCQFPFPSAVQCKKLLASAASVLRTVLGSLLWLVSHGLLLLYHGTYNWFRCNLGWNQTFQQILPSSKESLIFTYPLWCVLLYEISTEILYGSRLVQYFVRGLNLPILVVSLVLWLWLSPLPLALGVLVGYVVFYFGAANSLGAPPMSTHSKFMAATWPHQGSAYGLLEVDAEPALEYLKKQEVLGTHLTITTLVIKAVAMSLREAPGLRGRLVFGKFLPHSTIDLSLFIGPDLVSSTKISRADCRPLSQIHSYVHKKAEKLRSKQDKEFASKPLLQLLPVEGIRAVLHFVGILAGDLGLRLPMLGVYPFPFGTCCISALNPLGVQQAFLPLLPFARVPMMVSIGSVQAKAVVLEGQIVARKMLALTATVDPRFLNATEIARMNSRLIHLLTHPDELEEFSMGMKESVSSPALPSSPSLSSPALPSSPSLSSPALPSSPSLSSPPALPSPSLSSPALPSSPSLSSPPALPSSPSLSSPALPSSPSLSSPPALPSPSLSSPALPSPVLPVQVLMYFCLISYR
eukprot:g7443.t1